MANKMELRMMTRGTSKPEPVTEQEAEMTTRIPRGIGPTTYVVSTQPDFNDRLAQLLETVTDYSKHDPHRGSSESKSKVADELVKRLRELKPDVKLAVGTHRNFDAGIEILIDTDINKGKNGDTLKFKIHSNGATNVYSGKSILPGIEKENRLVSDDFYKKNPKTPLEFHDHVSRTSYATLSVDEAVEYARRTAGIPETPKAAQTNARQITDGVTPENSPVRESIHRELQDKIKNHIRNDPKFRFWQTPEAGRKTAFTNLIVEGNNTLTIVETEDGRVQFHKTPPNSEGMAFTGKTEIASTHKTSEAIANFKAVAANQELAKGLDKIVTESGNTLTSKIDVSHGEARTTIEFAGKPLMHIHQKMGEIRIHAPGSQRFEFKDRLDDPSIHEPIRSGLNTNEALKLIGEVIGSNAKKPILQQVIETIKVGGKGGVGKGGAGTGGTILAIGSMILTSKVEAAQNKGSQEPPQGSDRFDGMMGPAILLKEAAKAYTGSKSESQKNKVQDLSEADKRAAADVAKQMNNFGIPLPTSDAAKSAPAHATIKPQKVETTQRGG